MAPVKHGEFTKKKCSKLYHVWSGMIQRCTNPNHPSYHKYGPRGITVCALWAHNYRTFRDWALSHGYQEGLQIDRIDNDAGYCPENCHWVLPVQNANNTRQNVHITAFGETKTLSEWTRDPRCTTKYNALAWRIRQGWSGEAALTR